MTYQATVVTVMIGGPSDVSGPKNQVRQALAQWNAMHSQSLQIVLVPVSWDTDSSPSMHAPPQAVITEDLAGFDILVAIFWTRLGTPTEKAVSGTVEEIENAIALDKRTMVYFWKKSVPQDKIDLEQYTALTNFKNALLPRGLCHEFISPTEFGREFGRHLHQAVKKLIPESTALLKSQPLTAPRVPSLSSEEKALLLSAVAGDGTVMHLVTMGGTSVGTSLREFVTSQDGRSEAKWRAVVKNLAAKQLIEDRRGKGELYFVTDEGYQVAEILDPEVTA